MTPRDSLLRAIQKAKGQLPFAKLIGTTQSQVWYWLNKSKKGVPAEFAVIIEEKTGEPRHLMRPDIFPSPPNSGTDTCPAP